MAATEAVLGFLVVLAALVLPFALLTYSRSPVPRQNSKLSTTMDLYVHAYDEDLRGAVNTLGVAVSS